MIEDVSIVFKVFLYWYYILSNQSYKILNKDIDSVIYHLSPWHKGL